MTGSAQRKAARLAGGVLLVAAIVPGFAAGSAFAAEPDAPVVTSTTPADEVGIGTAVKIGNPDVVASPSASVDAQGRSNKVAVAPGADDTFFPSAVPDGEIPGDEDEAAASDEATPADAEVIETESHQAAVTPDPETSVLGTKVGNSLAETGSDVTGQVLLALALILGGVALRFGPQVAQAAARRKH